MVAGVFVRVFNDNPAAMLADPAAFCRGLVTYVHAQAAPAAFAQAAADGAAAAQGKAPLESSCTDAQLTVPSAAGQRVAC